ncbi:hypothetical protein [Sphingobacterium zeae]|uniref:Uncharacterized protein n=1 Tax=Sphingobacterium zeae TaxID=1776859 RepID=A0ABU0UCX2_9SPHI|nr:hypothetical protein [Sphingobacterium zeae]MDQ1152711.1 hypothetical protein [Sphingobacterium zeae]
MLGKIFHLLILFAYLNLLTYDSFSSATGQVVHAGETIVEYFLDDVLDLDPIQSSHEEKVLLQDDYRIFAVNSQVLPIFIFVFGIVFTALCFAKDDEHPFYRSKTICRPGYYHFLYRFRPF